MRHQNVIKRNKTIYARNAPLWYVFIKVAFSQRISTSELLERAMAHYLDTVPTVAPADWRQFPVTFDTPLLTNGKDTD